MGFLPSARDARARLAGPRLFGGCWVRAYTVGTERDRRKEEWRRRRLPADGIAGTSVCQHVSRGCLSSMSSISRLCGCVDVLGGCAVGDSLHWSDWRRNLLPGEPGHARINALVSCSLALSLLHPRGESSGDQDPLSRAGAVLPPPRHQGAFHAVGSLRRICHVPIVIRSLADQRSVTARPLPARDRTTRESSHSEAGLFRGRCTVSDVRHGGRAKAERQEEFSFGESLRSDMRRSEKVLQLIFEQKMGRGGVGRCSASNPDSSGADVKRVKRSHVTCPALYM